MKAQDRYPYDSAILGLNGTYQTIDSDSFYINSDCIHATDKTITIGKPYIIFDTLTEKGIKITEVTLVDCYYYEGIIHLILKDIRSQRVFTISQCLECPEDDCTWVLVELNISKDKMDAQAIRQYCGNCDYSEKKPSVENKHQNRYDDDLLEFEF